ncbi:uncharacterized protein LOC134186411 isoform X2 [Corticium candelabrum]|uniref:uncharacterized protein LOC134186411 isoform X2 n=1 Tax=Corticium candelabrum TaxID=121492 RepID=UPI002E26C2CA|nr:uncharacterized protein LOC134186411 isoform X2 [Corticium candelabrum]
MEIFTLQLQRLSLDLVALNSGSCLLLLLLSTAHCSTDSDANCFRQSRGQEDYNDWRRVIATKTNSPSQRLGHTAVFSKFRYFKNQVMIVYGGVDTFLPSEEGARSSHWYGDVWVYNEESNSWVNIISAEFIPRAYHSAVVIGSEMITFGGLNLNETMNDTWHFNLEVGVWKPGGNGPGKRFLHAAVALSNDKMLIFFGKEYSEITGKAGHCYDDMWQYDPQSHSWTSLNPTPDSVYGKPGGRSGHTAVYFQGSNIVLVLGGGQCRFTSVLNELWEYNVEGNSWHYRTPMKYQVMDHVSVSLANLVTTEVMFIYGGTIEGDDDLISQGMFLYHVDKDEWQKALSVTANIHSIPSRRTHSSAVLMTFAMVLFGGEDSTTSMPLDDLWEMHAYSLNASVIMWQKVNSPDIGPSPRAGSSLVPLHEYGVLFGGYDGFMVSEPYTWVYHGYTGMWLEINTISPQQRVCHAATAYSSDSIIISGGFYFSYTSVYNETVLSLRDMAIFNLNIFSWEELIILWKDGGRPMPRGNHVIFKVSNGDIHLLGGLFVSQSGNHHEVLSDHWVVYKDGGLFFWKLITCNNYSSCPHARAGHSAVTLLDGRVMVFGGMSSSLQSTNELWEYDCEINRWTEIHSDYHSPPASVYHSAAVWGYKMFIHGGCETPTFEVPFWRHFLNCERLVHNQYVWMFDGTTHSWSRLHMMDGPTARYGHSIAILRVSNNPELLLFGGFELAANTLGASVRPDGTSFTTNLGCNAGEFSRNFSKYPCRLCNNGTYAMYPGTRICNSCPSGTTTKSAGSLNRTKCTVCASDPCHGRGKCHVLANSHIQCTCHFGFDSESKCTQVQKSVVLFAAIILLSFVVLAIVVLLVVRHRLYKQRQMEAFRTIQLSQKAMEDLQAAFQIESSEITFRERVDRDSPGSFGEVWLAEYRELPVAVKKLKQRLIEPTFERHFAREIEFMKTIRHTNIVLFIGVGYVPPNNQAILVTEYLRRGALSTILQDHSIVIQYSQKLRFCSDAAKGMRFLHNLNPPRIHRDLKCGNLLVSDRWIVKVADFGTARFIQQLDEPQDVDKEPESIVPHHLDEERKPLLEAQKLMSESVGTLLWRAPETFFEKKYGASVDVYSFGIVMWEIMSQKVPYDDCRTSYMYQLAELVRQGQRPSLHDNEPADYISLMKRCWDGNPQKRPMFGEILTRLDLLQEKSGTVAVN